MFMGTISSLQWKLNVCNTNTPQTHAPTQSIGVLGGCANGLSSTEGLGGWVNGVKDSVLANEAMSLHENTPAMP